MGQDRKEKNSGLDKELIISLRYKKVNLESKMFKTHLCFIPLEMGNSITGGTHVYLGRYITLQILHGIYWSLYCRFCPEPISVCRIKCSYMKAAYRCLAGPWDIYILKDQETTNCTSPDSETWLLWMDNLIRSFPVLQLIRRQLLSLGAMSSELIGQ